MNDTNTPRDKLRSLWRKILAFLGIAAVCVAAFVVPSSASYYGYLADSPNYAVLQPMYNYTRIWYDYTYDEANVYEEYGGLTWTAPVLQVPRHYTYDDIFDTEWDNGDGETLFPRYNADYERIDGYPIDARGLLVQGYTGVKDTQVVQHVITDAVVWRGGSVPTFTLGSLTCHDSALTCVLSCAYVSDLNELKQLNVTYSAASPFAPTTGAEGLDMYTYDIGVLLAQALPDDVDYGKPVYVNELRISVPTRANSLDYKVFLPYLWNGTSTPPTLGINIFDVIPRVTETIDVDGFGERLYEGVAHVLSIELLPNLTIGLLFGASLGIVLLIAFVKLFAGG